MATSQERFTQLLRDEILKLDMAELDFGIYRILAYRRDELETFLRTTLPQTLQAALGAHVQDRLETLERTLDSRREAVERGATMLGFSSAFLPDGSLNPALSKSPAGEDFLQARDELARARAHAAIARSEEDALYNHLLTFFARYWRDGDFLPQMRRGGAERFVVPYNGQDVHFHWKSRGSHYIKTSEELASYTAQHNPPLGWRLRIELVSADAEERDNTKGRTRYFFPDPRKLDTDKKTKTFVIPCAFRLPTDKEQKAFEKAKLDKTTANGNGSSFQRWILENALKEILPLTPKTLPHDFVTRHLRRYATRHRVDYFVHPHLGPFLRAEWDHYLKAEYLNLDAFTDADALNDRLVKLKALRQIGNQLIDALHHIESFQAALFEKRKFVLAADYLLPIRLVPDELHAEVLQNPAQLDAWKRLFHIKTPPTEKTLPQHPTLVLDTRLFDDDFKRRLLESYDDLDDLTDGVLVHGENFAALRTLEPVLAGEVDCVFIDPPYNTGNDGFLYKDDFEKHSTWLSMMDSRLQIARRLLAEDGCILVSLDENEHPRLRHLMDEVFGLENFIATVIWHKVYVPKNSTRHFSEDHDYILVYARSLDNWSPGLLPRTKEQDAKYSNPDNDLRGLWRPGPIAARNFYSKGQYSIKCPGGRIISGPPSGSYWRFSEEKLKQMDQDGRIYWGADGNNVPAPKLFLSEVKDGRVPQTIWPYKEVGHTQEAKQEVQAVVDYQTTESVFNTLKPLRLLQRVLAIGTPGEEDDRSWVLDFFAGSGTTAHAVIQQNREDGSRRRFVLVEMGDYFDSLIVQRVQRVMYCPTWKGGVPQDAPTHTLPGTWPQWVERSPRLVKLLKLESYDDTLNAIELPEERAARLGDQLDLGLGLGAELRYVLEDQDGANPVLLNAARLEDPFTYALSTHTPDGVKEQAVDLVETASWLLGLRVHRLHWLQHDKRPYRLVEASRGSARVLVVWRPVKGLDPIAEREWLGGQVELESFQTIYTNADSAIPNAESLDGLLRDRMFEPVSAAPTGRG